MFKGLDTAKMGDFTLRLVRSTAGYNVLLNIQGVKELLCVKYIQGLRDLMAHLSGLFWKENMDSFVMGVDLMMK
ncbi:MAG: hypothetical protein ACLUR5_13415 [Eubacterium ventriosum]